MLDKNPGRITQHKLCIYAKNLFRVALRKRLEGYDAFC
jgi:hypothetical protein